MKDESLLPYFGMLFAGMVVLSFVEVVVPLRKRPSFDAARTGANIGLTVILFALNTALGAAALALIVALSARGIGLFSHLALPSVVTVMASVVLLDFSTYLAHLLMHKVPMLWRVHRIHHSDSFVDVTTTYRFHPGEGLWRFAMVMGPAIALGVPAHALLLYRLASAINGLFEHTNVRMPQWLDTAVSFVWVTPNMHKVHHSRAHYESDTNYGNLLSLFDRALRTFTPSVRASSVTYGLETNPNDTRTIAHLLRWPFVRRSISG